MRTRPASQAGGQYRADRSSQNQSHLFRSPGVRWFPCPYNGCSSSERRHIRNLKMRTARMATFRPGCHPGSVSSRRGEGPNFWQTLLPAWRKGLTPGLGLDVATCFLEMSCGILLVFGANRSECTASGECVRCRRLVFAVDVLESAGKSCYPASSVISVFAETRPVVDSLPANVRGVFFSRE